MSRCTVKLGTAPGSLLVDLNKMCNDKAPTETSPAAKSACEADSRCEWNMACTTSPTLSTNAVAILGCNALKTENECKEWGFGGHDRACSWYEEDSAGGAGGGGREEGASGGGGGGGKTALFVVGAVVVAVVAWFVFQRGTPEEKRPKTIDQILQSVRTTRPPPSQASQAT